MKAAGITLSTVGAGGGSNPFLEQLAKNGGGRFYAAANVRPRSPTSSSRRRSRSPASRSSRRRSSRSRRLLADHRGLEDGLPRLLGYNGTTIKSAAQLVLVSPRDDPLLAQWQYGLGRSVAWTSDSTGRWAKNWVGWPGFSRFFTQLVAWTFPGDETDGIEASFETVGGQTRLHVESVEADGSPRDFYNTLASITGPTSRRRRSARPGRAGRLRGEPRRDRVRRLRGADHADARRRTGAGADGRARGAGGGRVPAPGREPAAPRRAALRDRRREIELPTDPWRHDLKTTSSFTELWPWLLVLALLLWPLDVALRRVSLGRRELVDARGWVGRRCGRRRAAAPRTAAAEGMLAARERGRGQRGASRAAARPGGRRGGGPPPAGRAASGHSAERGRARRSDTACPPARTNTGARPDSKAASLAGRGRHGRGHLPEGDRGDRHAGPAARGEAPGRGGESPGRPASRAETERSRYRARVTTRSTSEDPMAAPEVLWEPPADAAHASRMGRYLDWLADAGAPVRTYDEAWRWSVDDSRAGSGGRSGTTSRCRATSARPRDLADARMPGASWFPGATLNYAEHALRLPGRGGR